MGNKSVDEKVLNEIFFKIRLAEGKNVRTGQYDDRTMVRMIVNEIHRAVINERGEDEEV